jgi:anti-sigma regulatory factor (Ser/Thr protein kinase)
MTSGTGDDLGRARHRALVYEHADRFVEAVTAFVLAGVRDGDRTLVAATVEKLDWLREALGDDAPAVQFAEADALYARLGPMFATVVDFMARHGTGGRVRIVAEQALANRTPADARAYMGYEAAANVAYRPYAASVLCPYDADRLPEHVIRDALRTHPELLDGEHERRNPAFIDPRQFLRERMRVEPAPADARAFRLERLEDVAPVRRQVAALAQAAGVATARIDEVRVAVGEIATNALLHGRAPAHLWSYVRDDAFVCHVHDGGRGLADPLVGYLVPSHEARGGRGVWLAHQLCDSVEAAADGTGTHLYLRFALERPAQQPAA